MNRSFALFALVLLVAVVAGKHASTKEDIHKVARALKKDTHLSASVKKAQLKNLKEMEEDAKALDEDAGDVEAKADIKKRMSKVKSALSTPHSAKPAFKKAHTAKPATAKATHNGASKVDSVLKDVKAAKSEVSHEHLADSKEWNNNLDKIARDAEEYKSASGDHKKNLAKAMKLRVEAMKKAAQTETHVKAAATQKVPVKFDSKSKSSAQKAAAVTKDIAAVERQMEEMNLSEDVSERVEENLSAMKKDAAKLSTASPAMRNKLSKALSLRMKALKKDASLEETKPAHKVASKVKAPKASAPKASAHKVAAQPKTAEKKAAKTPAAFAKKAEVISKAIAEVERQMEEAEVPEAIATRVEQNIAAMKKDVKSLASGTKEHAAKIAKALELRLEALRADAKAVEAKDVEGDDDDEE